MQTGEHLYVKQFYLGLPTEQYYSHESPTGIKTQNWKNIAQNMKYFIQKVSERLGFT